MSLEQQLRAKINQHLTVCCSSALADLHELIQDESGMQQAEDIIFEMCKQRGISVQSAMTKLNSDLNE